MAVGLVNRVWHTIHYLVGGSFFVYQHYGSRVKCASKQPKRSLNLNFRSLIEPGEHKSQSMVHHSFLRTYHNRQIAPVDQEERFDNQNKSSLRSQDQASSRRHCFLQCQSLVQDA